MGGKWLETLKEVSPGISRALVLLLPDVAANVEFLRAAQAAGPVHNVAVEGAGVRNTDDVHAHDDRASATGRQPEWLHYPIPSLAEIAN